MTKACTCLGDYVPYGQGFLEDDTNGSYRLVSNERDGILAEEELYAAGDGRIIWSSGRHILRGFQAATKAVHLFVCSFSSLSPEPSNAAPSLAETIAESAVDNKRCYCVLEPNILTVYASSGADFLVHVPMRAVYAWPLGDGILLLIASSPGVFHAVSLVGHPLNLPRCISYIDVYPNSTNTSRVWKDVPLASGSEPKDSAQLRWVSSELPLAVAHLPASQNHAVYLIRRCANSPSIAMPQQLENTNKTSCFETATVCREASEVYLQQLWLFPEEGPACELDDVCLLCPDYELAHSDGLLLMLFVRATQKIYIVRLWSWELVATLNNCCSVVPLLPGDDIRTRHACPSGLAGFPSPWLNAYHCRTVLKEARGPQIPIIQGLPQDLVQLLLDPLELTRSSAVLCFDRHRLPQYLLVLNRDQRSLSIYWGAAYLCNAKITDKQPGGETLQKSIVSLKDAVANRFTVCCDDGHMYRCFAPFQPHSPRLAAALTALAVGLPQELAQSVVGDAQVWCVRRGLGHSSNVDSEDEEWRRFCELLFCLVERALVSDSDRHSPPFKRARTFDGAEVVADMQCESEADDWEWLLGSSMHAQERLNPLNAGFIDSVDFLPHPALRRLAADASRRGATVAPSDTVESTNDVVPCSDAADVWEGVTSTSPQLLLQHLDSVFLILHLLYEEWKLQVLHAKLLPPLALLLYGLSRRLQCPQFAAFYAQDFPCVRDAGVAMTSLGNYGAWLWQAFPNESLGPGERASNVAESVRKLREAHVPHLLAACRQIQSATESRNPSCIDSFPPVFPLSSLMLSITRILSGAPKQHSSVLRMPQFAKARSVANIPDLPMLTPPCPMPPFTASPRRAHEDAEHARRIRKWIEEFSASTEQPPWEVALMLLVQHRITRADVDLWCLVLAAPVRECLRAAAESPKSDWSIDAYSLIGRDDLALLASGQDSSREGMSVGNPRRANVLEATNNSTGFDDCLGSSTSADPLEASEWLYRMFDRDRRVKEVVRLLNSSRPVTLRITRRPEQTDHDFEQYKQSRLGLAANRQAALCVGRGAFTLGAVRPLPTELLRTPLLALAGRFPPQTAVVSLDPNHHSAELNIWAEFSNGVATALQVGDAPGVEITRGWILHHKSEAATNGQTSAHAHAGFLCGLGLRGHLRVMPVADCYKYLRSQHDTTSVAVILGMAASHVGSMDAGLTRMCCVHIPSMLPATYSDMEVASPVQCAAVLSLGVLFARSAHRMMTELLVAEIGRRPSDRALHDREGYSLAAGFALGCVCLGLGADAPGLADLQLHTWLLRYIHGGPEMPMPGAATRDQKQNPNHDPATCSSVIAEGEGINVCITSPAGCVALALMFLRTNCEAVASRIVIPQNIFQLDFIRPDFAMLRLVARCLIMWDSIEASEAWIAKQLPTFLKQLEADLDTPRGTSAPVPLEPTVASARQTQGRPPGFQSLNGGGVHDEASSSVASDLPPTQGSPTVLGGEAGAMDSSGNEQGAHLPAWDQDSDIDWLLVGQTRASLIAGACLAIGLRFAGTSDPAAKHILVEKLQMFRDAGRSTQHPARMASLPTPGMDLDRSTLETCQSVTAMSLGMVMAGTGDLSALRVLRSLRKRADLETGYGVHMATHSAIGLVFLGGGRYTFDQDNLSIAMLLMAAFPRYPISLTDNRCHLQAFRHLYVLAARHRCVEAVEVDAKQTVDVMVSLESERGSESAMLPRLMLASKDVRSITLQSERYWPVVIRRPLPGENLAVGRWMQTLESSRRFYVKRRCGHLPHRLDGFGAQGAAQAWFPTYTEPSKQHVERLLQIPKAEAAGKSGQGTKDAVVELSWLRRTGAEGGGGPLELGTLTVSSAEWAAALCCECPPLLPIDAYDFDFEDDGDGTISERFATYLRDKGPTSSGSASISLSPRARFGQWLHECIINSKLETYPYYLMLYLQTRSAAEGSWKPSLLSTGPAALVCSSIVVDQLITVEQFYNKVRGRIKASHSPLLSEDFLVERCAAVRKTFAVGGCLAPHVPAALRAQYSEEGRCEKHTFDASSIALAAVYTRLHCIPGFVAKLDSFIGARTEVEALSMLPRLRRQIPSASAAGLQTLCAALTSAGA